MTVLVTGASGLLGGTVAALLRDRGERVRVLQRRPSRLVGVEEVQGSVTDADAVARAVEGTDAVVHLAAKVSMTGPEAEFEAVNVEGTRALLAAAAGRPTVFVSSPSVAHAGTALAGAGADPADPARARGAYARTKAAAELLALAAGAVAVRPHLVWGPGDEQLVARIVGRARSGRLVVVGSGAALVDTTYVSNAADALVAALDAVRERPDVVGGRAYVVTNGEPRPLAELVERICRAAGVPGPRRHVPRRVALAAGAGVERVWPLLADRVPGDGEPPLTRFLAEQLSTAHWFDQAETRAALRWTPAVGLEEGFARLAAAYRSGG
ncbi:nucleoside-diphosphate-sugar epimerase [Motilibacter rhizosphaerae]|uniref:Nucleoside-diphosphate-sugar epimerase n=1 Tax=Motilibacter rhizosphaerae TaxID=598652 RepID=A0A4Q7NWI7_9ACTN|nr:NAD-dependent epimerase/dehydratase family protein [Motilibacter rhizosphaerae]RZS91278.1 nucleoside-diphosphate-sugar epimerase [Motilibacter rhizosphaerae]